MTFSKVITKSMLLIIAVLSLVISGCSTTLHEAAEVGNLTLVKKLLESGEDINDKEFRHNLTPLDFAILNNKDEVASYLIKKGAKSVGAPVIAAFKGNMDVFKLLETNHFDVRRAVNTFDYCVFYNFGNGCGVFKNGQNLNLNITPLLAAAYNNNDQLVEYILSNKLTDETTDYPKLNESNISAYCATQQGGGFTRENFVYKNLIILLIIYQRQKLKLLPTEINKINHLMQIMKI